MGEAYAMSTNPGKGGAESTGSMFGLMPMFVVMFVVLYFFMIRPQQKKQKETQAMLQNLKKGDRVTTAGGMYGTVVGIKEDVVTLKIADNAKVEFRKSAISNVVQRESPAG